MGRLAWWDAACGPAPHRSSSSSNRLRPDTDVIHLAPIRAAVGRPRPAPRPPSPLGPSTVGHAGRRRIPRTRRHPPPRGPAGQQGCSPPPASTASAPADHRRFLRGAAAGRGRGRLHGAARRPALGLLLRWLRHCIEDRLRAPLQHHRSRPLPSFGSKKLRLQLRWLQIPLTPSFPLLGDCLLESTTQTPLVVVFSIITTMVSTCFLPSAQLSISKAFASAKLGEVRTALDSFIFFLLFVLHTFNSFMLLLLH